MNQNGQAAEEKKTKGRGGLDAAKAVLASSSGRSVFRLTSPAQSPKEPRRITSAVTPHVGVCQQWDPFA
jgi:hypothetical protein